MRRNMKYIHIFLVLIFSAPLYAMEEVTVVENRGLYGELDTQVEPLSIDNNEIFLQTTIDYYTPRRNVWNMSLFFIGRG
ncbi:MAG: hypothetical protein EBY41_06050 [Proteobacteria bacterium]|jgi:hypothetical protein|nr:hypothetical protein [Pseudomonadota bacterium]